MSESKEIRILYMEDDPGLARLFQKKLERAGYIVDLACDGEEGLAMYAAGSYAVVAVDQAMPVHDGLEVIRVIARLSEGFLPPMIMITGTGNEKIAVEAMKLGARDYIVKDVDGGYLELLPPVIERVLQQHRLVEEKQRAEAERERLLVAEREQRLLAETLRDVALALTSQTSHAAVLDEILRQAQRIVPHNTANIALLKDDALRIVCWQGYQDSAWTERASSLVQPLADFVLDAEVIRSRHPLVISDIRQEPRWLAHDETNWIKSYLSLPLCLRDRVLGVLRLDGATLGEFSAEDAQRLLPLVSAAAIAIENAQLVEGLEDEVAARTAEIAAEKEKSETILRNVDDAISMSDLEMRLRYVNPAFTALTGYTAQEVIGQHVGFFSRQTMPEQERQSLRFALAQGEVWRGEVSSWRKDGRPYAAAITITPMRDAAGRVTGYVSSHRDVSQRKALDQARDRFITNISHQLRTPVTNLKLYTHILRKGAPAEKPERYLQILDEQVDQLTHLVQDIVEMTVLDSGQALTDWRAISLPIIIGDTITRYHRQAAAAGLTLLAAPVPPDPAARFAKRSESPAMRARLSSAKAADPFESGTGQSLPAVKGDQARLSQALDELVENAVVFTPAGGQVTVETGMAEAEGQHWVTLAVRDTGPGISAEEQKRVFERFYRGSLAESGHVPGTGMGLAIVKAIVEGHGGRVTVESFPSVPPDSGGEDKGGTGSTFTIWLPPAG